ncbi:dual specificity phosphatase [Catovirus CTV1]|uniref:Dual specificity phosphatase n=1 Tax=Catovirus CTV1 TaxID=1977631 RepID=A0A1V0SBE3_9VIRU|nr:dual specificity phosphatase [Catovirus CTV1]
MRCCKGEKDVTEIIPNLWLGNYKSALSRKFIEKRKIKYVINLTKHIPNIFQKNGVKYLNILIDDSDTCFKDQTPIFDQCCEFILNAIKRKESILVHCQKGHHRSASIVAAFLIKYLNLDYITTVSYINIKRKCALTRNSCMTQGLYQYYINHSII